MYAMMKKNTLSGIWKDENWIREYKISETKRIHDVLAYAEVLDYIDGVKSKRLNYQPVEPEAVDIAGNKTKFGSIPLDSSHILAATTWKIA